MSGYFRRAFDKAMRRTAAEMEARVKREVTAGGKLEPEEPWPPPPSLRVVIAAPGYHLTIKKLQLASDAIERIRDEIEAELRHAEIQERVKGVASP